MTSRKQNIAIVLFTNLGVDAGTEVIARELSSNFNVSNLVSSITIVQTDYMGNQNPSKRISPGVFKGINIVELNSPLKMRSIRNLINRTDSLKLFGEVLKNSLYLLYNFKEMRMILNTVDVVVFLSYNEAWTWFIFNKKHVKYVISGECDLPAKYIQKRIIISKSDKIHFLTSKQMNQFGGIKTQEFFIVPNGVNSKLFYPKEIRVPENKTKIKVLYVGRLEKEKGVLDILQAAMYLEMEDWIEITIVGIGTLDKTIDKKCYKNVKFHGYIPNDQLSAFYSDTDIFLFPSHGEPYGSVVLEAISSGAYALVSKNLIGHFDDFEALGALKYIDTDPTIIARELQMMKCFHLNYSKKMEFHNYIEQNYDWKTIAKKWIENFQS